MERDDDQEILEPSTNQESKGVKAKGRAAKKHDNIDQVPHNNEEGAQSDAMEVVQSDAIEGALITDDEEVFEETGVLQHDIPEEAETLPHTESIAHINVQDAEESKSGVGAGRDFFLKGIQAKRKLQEQFSTVAATPSHKKFMALGLVGVIGILVYVSFFAGSETEEERKSKYNEDIQHKKDTIIKDATSVPKAPKERALADIPKLPETPVLVNPSPPEPPPLPMPETPPAPIVEIGGKSDNPDAPSLPLGSIPPPASTAAAMPFQGMSDEEKQKLLDAKRKAGIMVFGGGSGGIGSDIMGHGKDKDKDDSKDKAGEKGNAKVGAQFLGFGDGAFDGGGIEASTATNVTATIVKHLDRTIVQGKMVYAVLETAINTDLPGTLRAVVARDVYAESGRNILLPKGSRLIGSYDSSVKAGQVRIAVMWERLIRPDGIDIAIGSAGVDALGRAGVRGQLDSKFWTRLASAFLISYVIPLTAQRISGTGNEQITTSTAAGTNGDQTTTTTGSAKAIALQDSADEFTSLMEDVVKESFVSHPTITVDQGTSINVLVQKDLIFPAQAVNGNLMVK